MARRTTIMKYIKKCTEEPQATITFDSPSHLFSFPFGVAIMILVLVEIFMTFVAYQTLLLTSLPRITALIKDRIPKTVTLLKTDTHYSSPRFHNLNCTPSLDYPVSRNLNCTPSLDKTVYTPHVYITSPFTYSEHP
jgi:hypothetical protein